MQEVEAEEDRLWKEQVEAARARAGSEKERYRRIREVRLTGPLVSQWLALSLTMVLVVERSAYCDVQLWQMSAAGYIPGSPPGVPPTISHVRTYLHIVLLCNSDH